MRWLSQTRNNRRYNAFAAPSSPRDWHGGPFPTHGELAQGLNLTMRPTRTASPLCFFSPQWPESWLSPAFCANILAHFEVCFQKFGYIYIYPVKKSAIYFSKIFKDLWTENRGKLPRKFGLHFSHAWKICILKKTSNGSSFGWLIRQMSINQKSGRKTFRRRFLSGSIVVVPCPTECYFQSETKNRAWSQVIGLPVYVL